VARYAALKNLHIERETFVARVTFAMTVCGALAALLAGRLVQLQVVEHAYYTTRSDENRMRLTVIPPVRGLVYDRNGALLAQNAPGFRLEVVREQVPDLDRALWARSPPTASCTICTPISRPTTSSPTRRSDHLTFEMTLKWKYSCAKNVIMNSYPEREIPPTRRDVLNHTS
jgi:hypothetical protein